MIGIFCTIFSGASCSGTCQSDTPTTDSVHSSQPVPISVAFNADSGTVSADPSIYVHAPKEMMTQRGTDPGCPTNMMRIDGGALRNQRKVEVAIADMCVDRTEVTVHAYAECVAMGACLEPGRGNACNWGIPERDMHPINCVDQPSAKAFCAYKSGRLPTFNEWEWIAEGRTAALTYPWGNAPPAEHACWSGVVKRQETCRVASSRAGDSPQGVSDLSGNVLEWTTTPFEAMPDTFVLAGGSWWDEDPDALQVLAIHHDVPAQRSDMIGFRCVKTH